MNKHDADFYAKLTPVETLSNSADIFREAPLTVETVGNHIYFFSPVDGDRTLALIQQLRHIDRDLVSEHKARDLGGIQQPTPIWLHIQSGGGSLFSAFAVADEIPRLQTPVYSIVSGICASAATLISMACDKRYIYPRSFMLIHQLWSIMWGTHEQFVDDMKLQKELMAQMVDFYETHSNMTVAQIKALLKRDSWMNADTAVENGLCDEVLVPQKSSKR